MLEYYVVAQDAVNRSYPRIPRPHSVSYLLRIEIYYVFYDTKTCVLDLN